MHCLSRSALNTYLILWGIIGILAYHVDRNAGHAYLRDGVSEPKTPGSCLKILHAKFGRMQSTIGDGILQQHLAVQFVQDLHRRTVAAVRAL